LAPTALPEAADEGWHESLAAVADAGLSLSVAVPIQEADSGSLVERLCQLRRWQADHPFIAAVLPVPAPLDPFAEKALPSTGLTLLQGVALCRLILDNVSHVSAAWPTLGVKPAQIALTCGADDWLGTDDAVPDDANGPMSDARAVELITTAGLTPLWRGAAYVTRRILT
jgi:2-iminoacetate synthase ThiH